MYKKIIKSNILRRFLAREQAIANVLMMVVVLFWGASFISIKIAVAEIPPITMALLRFAIASVFLVGILKKVEPQARLARKDIPFVGLGGIFGITLYFFFENTGVKLSTAANASLIVMVVPMITIVLDMLFFRSKMSGLKLAGVGIAVLGTYLSVTGHGEVDFSSANFKGNLLVLGAMVTWALYTLINKSLQGKYSGIVLTAYQTLFGTVCLVPLSLLEYESWRVFSFTAFLHVLFLAVCCSVICYLLYLYVLKRLDVAVTTLYLNLVPVVGVLGGYWVLGERVLSIQLLGGIATVFSIVLVNLDQLLQRLKKVSLEVECS